MRPLFVPFAPDRETAADLLARLPGLVEQYRAEYTAYYQRCRRADSPPMRDPYPVIVLIPGLGLLSFQKDKATARVAAEFYESTIRIMRWAEGVDEYAPIGEQEAFDIEYWSLEEAKLRRLPPAKSLEGRDRVGDGRRRRHRPGDRARVCWPKVQRWFSPISTTRR